MRRLTIEQAPSRGRLSQEEYQAALNRWLEDNIRKLIEKVNFLDEHKADQAEKAIFF